MTTMTSETRAGQAIEGLRVTCAGGVVMVRDGHCTWLCEESAWDVAYEALDERAALDGDDAGMLAYSELCREARARSAIASNDAAYGTHEAQTSLVHRAVAAGLLGDWEVHAFGVPGVAA